LENVPPEAVRAVNGVAQGNHVDAGNPSRPPAINDPITVFPVVGSALSDLLRTLTPLAFISASKSEQVENGLNNSGQAKPTQLYDADADTFLYALASGVGSQPDQLFLFYEDLSRTKENFPQHQVVANISLPLTVLNSDLVTERPVATTLQFRAPVTGGLPCSAATVVGDFNRSGIPQTLSAAQIGVDCAVVFSPSPISAKAHAVFELKLLPIVTRATDPAYFTRVSIPLYGGFVPPLSPFLPLAFIADELGFAPTPGILGSSGKYIGVAPSAGPLCAADTCPPATYALCANLPGNHNRHPPVPAVAAFYAIATDGETLLSAPIVPSGPIVCPF
jgi:hypothetical protein